MNNHSQNRSQRVDFSLFADDVNQAVRVLRQGGIILYPTDTIWGLGCDPTNAEAVNRIYEIKHRPQCKSLLLLTDSPARLPFIVDVPDISYQLIEVADKPLTIIYPNARGLAPKVAADDNSVGIRITSEPFSRTLCQRFGRPIVSTSANVSGEPSPAFFNQISDEIKGAVDFIVSYRQDDTTPRHPSSIIALDMKNQFKIIH